MNRQNLSDGTESRICSHLGFFIINELSDNLISGWMMHEVNLPFLLSAGDQDCCFT